MTDTTPEPSTSVIDADTPPLTHYHHVTLTVTDVERSEAWYGEVLGFQRAFKESHPDGIGYAVVMTRPGTALFLGLAHHDSNAAEEFAEHRTGLDHLSLGVALREDIDRWAAHLDRLGVRRSPIAAEAVAGIDLALVNFRDPDNIALQLMWTR